MHSFHRHPFLSVKHDVYIFTFSTEEKITLLYVAFFVKFRVKLHLVNFFRLKTLENLRSLEEFLVPKKACWPAAVAPDVLQVSSPVLNKVGILTEFFSTVTTRKGLFSSVNSLVCAEI